MKAPKAEKYKFSNHLGMKMENRKNRRKQKRLIKKQLTGSQKNGCGNLSQLTNGKQMSSLQKTKNGKGKGKNPTNKKTSGSSKAAKTLVKNKNKSVEETGGFQLSSTDKERMARLQEFVNQEAGKMNKPSKKESSNKKQPIPEKEETNLIKNKKKLLSIRKDQENDTKEINRLAARIKLNSARKEKVAPMFADEFGDILADIEEGSMKRASAYTDEKARKTFMDSSDSEGSESDSNSECGDSDEENVFSKYNGKARGSGEIGNMIKQITKRHVTSYGEDNGTSEQDSGSSGTEDFSEKENDSDTGFIDSEAEECSEEESEDEMPVHDETKEYELAFEGGSRFYQNDAAVLDNGVMGYSSNSDDDTDLEDFVVDDDYVEFESGVESEDGNDKLLSPRKKKRRRVICEETDEDEMDDGSNHIENKTVPESLGGTPGDSTYSSPNKRKQKRLHDNSDAEESGIEAKPSQKGKKKRCLTVVTSESEKDSPTITPTVKKKKVKKVKSSMNEKGNKNSCTDNDADEPSSKRSKKKKSEKKPKKKNSENLGSDSKDSGCDDLSEVQDLGNNVTQLQSSDIREDIYGRLKDKEGNIVEQSDQSGNGKYIPPALRKLMAMNADEKKKEQIARLKSTLKGLLNRLAESNMAGIANQIEGMYQKYSHNDMNDCLSQLYMESLVAPTLTPERLVQEHALLIAVLSANVGNQVGAHMLTEFVLKLHDKMQDKSSSKEINYKEYDNMINLVANLFNFKVVDAKIIYDILQKLADVFTEKEVELILLVLRTVGFSLRKEDPLALKTFITQIQSQAASHQAKNSDNYTRICFMLEVIHSIKNNNPSKVPNYDPTHVEHLKKAMKGLIHKGNNLSPLHVTFDDILNSKSQGRWWIVGSAWSGGLKENRLPSSTTVVERKKVVCMEEEFSDHFKKRAAKLQLTRAPRINIMYVITEGSEDYLDAFDKLLLLKLPLNQEQEIFNVILLCCQKGKVYNEFFSHLAIRICKYDKRYKRLLQFSIWDKFQELENCKERELENIAKFVVHLVIEHALNITILKTLSFIDADEQMISFVKIILKAILLHPFGSDRVLKVFSKISIRPELHVFSQSLRIFISKFIISKKKKDKPKYQLLYTRSQEVLELLSMRGGVAL